MRIKIFSKLVGSIAIGIIILLIINMVPIGVASKNTGGSIPDQEYKIFLKSRQFVPAQGIGPNVEMKIKTSSLRRIHALMQFQNIPTTTERKELEKAGVKLLAYVPNNAWIVSMPNQNITIEKAKSKFMRWVDDLLPGDKVSSYIKENKFGAWATNPDGSINLIVEFFSDVSLDDAEKIIKNYKGVTNSRVASINALVVTVPQDTISKLSNEDYIQWIEQVSPPPSNELDQSRPLIGGDIVQTAPYNLNGSNVQVLVYDGGNVDNTHPDFQGRVTWGEVSVFGIQDHATHVAGIIAGNGSINSNLRGIAPLAEIISYDYDGNGLYQNPGNLEAEYRNAINTNGIDIASNSWGTQIASDDQPCDQEGDYNPTAQLLDNMVHGSLGRAINIVFSGGNERSPPSRCGDNYSTVNPPKSAKNIISVGAIYSDTSGMTCFSSWGPVDDGRIKPDIVAPGDEANDNPNPCNTGRRINSTLPGDTYGEMAGTSMAAPHVSGSAALILQEYRRTHNNIDPLPSSTKALLIHTAADLGNQGPDYQYGYGSINVRGAVDKIRADALQNVIIENNISANGERDNYYIDIPVGTTSLKVTLAWTDVPGQSFAARELVNDIDLIIFDPNGNRYYPWTLDPTTPASNAVRNKRDDLNNIEQIDVSNPIQGMWTMAVNGTIVPNPTQNYSLVSSLPMRQISGRQGGPDHFGYTFKDSNIQSGTIYDWIDITSAGTMILPNSDDIYVTGLPVGFFFNFYGNDYSQVSITNNGIVFASGGTGQFINQPIGSSNPHNFISPFWDDIVTWGSAGAIYYQTIGTAPNRMFVVEWYDNQHYSSSTSGITFEAILYEGTNNIKFQYKDVDFGTVSGSTGSDLPPYNNGGSATVGIEGPDGRGLQYSFNEQTLNPDMAILFKFPAFSGTNMYISKSAPSNMDHGNTMTYTLYYNNFGSTIASNVVLQDTLPSNVEFISASDGGNTRLAFQSMRDGNEEIYFMNSDSSSQTRLTRNTARDGYPAWSPDGRKITFSSNRDGNWEVYVMNSDGSGQIDLTRNAANDGYAVWSPDGRKIVFASDRDSPIPDRNEIYIMDTDGNNVVRLTSNAAEDVHPAWSPDGRKIAFASDRDGNREIYAMNADGSDLVDLTNNVGIYDDYPAWSSDSMKIVFASDRDSHDSTKLDIYTMNADGTNVIRLTNNAVDDRHPSWSKDGGKIIFSSDRDSNREIYVMNTDGTGVTRLTNQLGDDQHPTYDPKTVTWSIGSVAAFPSGRGTRTVTVRIPNSVSVGTVIQNSGSISTSTLETRYDDNSATASTTVAGSNLPQDVGIGPTNGNSGGTPSVVWHTPITFAYYSSCATGIDINIHINDGGPDITGTMTETSPNAWTYTTSFSRTGTTTVTYTISGCTTSSVSFNIYIDPAGYIYDANTGIRISGANVWLQRPDGQGGWENIPTGQNIMHPDTNPLTTGTNGQYQWDVLEGSYRVHVEASGYYPEDSIVVNIPPPVTDLHVGLTHIPITDAIPPTTIITLDGNIGNNGWYKSDVQVNLTATDNDGGSGINRIEYSYDNINWNIYTGQFSITNEGTTTIYYRSIDNNNNIESTRSQEVKIDKTLPDITINVPSDEGKYILNQNILADWSAIDSGSGIASKTGTKQTGETIDTATVGTKTFIVDAVDNAGNSATKTVSYNVVYNFNGFFQPVDNLPTLNSVKAGSAIPVKLSLNGDQGLDIFAIGYPVSQKISCDSNAPVDGIEETVTAGSSSLSYDATIDQYKYVWKTNKAWIGTCRNLAVKLNDGTYHNTSFKFK